VQGIHDGLNRFALKGVIFDGVRDVTLGYGDPNLAIGVLMLLDDVGNEDGLKASFEGFPDCKGVVSSRPKRSVLVLTKRLNGLMADVTSLDIEGPDGILGSW
jgi:hypothetical protein